jgi:hypothetical protein
MPTVPAAGVMTQMSPAGHPAAVSQTGVAPLAHVVSHVEPPAPPPPSKAAPPRQHI